MCPPGDVSSTAPTNELTPPFDRTRKLRAPAASGTVLAVPQLDSMVEIIRANRHLIGSWHLNFAGRSVQAWQQIARRELQHLATRYSLRYRDLAASADDAADRPLVLAGHQPHLFHPGVWIKNFAASALAERVAGRAFNLVVDNDQVGSHLLLPVPQRNSQGIISRGFVPLDQPGPAVPFENRPILDERQFAAIPELLARAMADWIPDPIARQLQPHWGPSRDPDGRWGASVAAARHALEGQCGLQTAELPISQLSQGLAFNGFIFEILTRLPEFHRSHARALAAYRRRNRIRSTAHPVPDLKQMGDWRETPFWTWRQGQPLRRPLYGRIRPHGIELSDRHDWTVMLSMPQGVEQLCELQNSGIAIRPRAITTTLFSRLLLCDLFIHGIGGAKYDEITDELFYDFWQISPPQFLTITATFRLPLDAPVITSPQLQAKAHELRELEFHPERFGALVTGEHQAAFQHWIDRKYSLLQNQPPKYHRLQWQQELAQTNQALQGFLSEHRRASMDQLEDWQKQLPVSLLTQSREYSFALHPSDLIPALKSAVLS